MKSKTVSLRAIIKELDFPKKVVIIQWSAWKKKYLLLLAIPDTRNAKEHYQSFMRKKNRKSVKQSVIITYQPKPFENPNTVDIKSIITEHSKTLHKYPKL